MPTETQVFLRHTASKLVLPTCLSLLFIWIAWRQISGVEASEVGIALRQIPLEAALVCCLLSALSLAAVSGYDVIAGRLLGVGLPPRQAFVTGFSAVAFGQALGFGVVTGTLIRWRMGRRYGRSLMEAAMVSGVVTMAFASALLLGLSFWLTFAPTEAAMITGLSEASMRALGLTGLGSGALLLGAGILIPEFDLSGRKIRLPGPRAIRRIGALTVLDLVPAGLAFWVLLPGELAPDPLSFLPIYALALGAALLSNAPAGIGALEATALICLPGIPTAELLAALIVYRGIYYGLPLIPAALLLLNAEIAGRGYERRRSSLPREDIIAPAGIGALPLDVELVLQRSSRAESALACLGDKSFLMAPDRKAFLMIARQGNSLIALGDPVGPAIHWPFLAKRFLEEADARLCEPCAYRIGSGWSGCLARHGLKVQKLGEEAFVDPASFSTEGPSARQLRRKMRHAEKEWLRIETFGPGRLPMKDLAEIDADWQRSHGRPMGFSQGVFAPEYLARFDCLVASIDDRPVAFVSLWRSGDGREMSIDVMRQRSDAPDGTMHSLIVAAIRQAGGDGVAQFSLCPVLLRGLDGVGAWLYHSDRFGRHLRGLARFKDLFAPDWRPVHIATRRRLPLEPARAIRALIMSPLQKPPVPDLK